VCVCVFVRACARALDLTVVIKNIQTEILIPFRISFKIFKFESVTYSPCSYVRAVRTFWDASMCLKLFMPMCVCVCVCVCVSVCVVCVYVCV
jgi:hypothetical protein